MITQRFICNYRVCVCLCLFVLIHGIAREFYFGCTIFETFLYFLKFAFKNFSVFLVMFFATKTDSKLLKKQTFAIMAWFLFFSYIFNTTNNIAVILLYTAINIKNKLKKHIVLASFLVALFSHFIFNMYYQNNYGFPEGRFIDPSQQPIVSIFKNPIKEIIPIKDKEFEIQKVASIELNAKAVSIKRFDKLLFNNSGEDDIFSAFSPIDLTVFVGEMANNWNKYKIEHEKRGVVVFGRNATSIDLNEWTHIRITPANENILKGFYTVKRGDDVYINGYLMDWKLVGGCNLSQAITARYFGEKLTVSPGVFTYLLSHIWVDELNVNGYTFK